MSQSKSKKVRKEVRKRVDKNFGIGMEALSNVVRKRPSWIPKQIWILTYLPLIPAKYLHHFYKHMN